MAEFKNLILDVEDEIAVLQIARQGIKCSEQ